MIIEQSQEVRDGIIRLSRELAEQEDLNYRIGEMIERRMVVPLDDRDKLNTVSELAGFFQVTKKRIYPLVVLGRRIGLGQVELGAFLERMLPYTTVYSAEELMQNPYMQKIRSIPAREGAFRFEETRFYSGELFFDREPAADGSRRINTLGILDGELYYPAFYEGDRCWMSITPNETVTMEQPIEEASGDVLTLGLGLGYYAYMAHRKDNVRSVTIVEREPEVIRIFKETLLPQFDHPDKIHIIEQDALDFLEHLEDGAYDYCFADIWQNPVDGMDDYLRARTLGNRFRKMRCSYWIEESFLGFLEQSIANLLQFEFLEEDDSQMLRTPGYGLMKTLLKDHEIKSEEDIRAMFGGDFVRGLLDRQGV